MRRVSALGRLREALKVASKMPLESAMREVHSDVPSNVEKTGKKGKAKETMLRAIAFSKAGKSKKGK